MSERKQLFDEDLIDVTGGKITYTWDGSVGTIGMNGRNPYTLTNKDAFVAFYKANHETMKDSEILRHLLNEGIAVAN